MTDNPAPNEGLDRILNEIEIRDFVITIVRGTGDDVDVTLDEEDIAAVLIEEHGEVTVQQVIDYCREEELISGEPKYDELLLHRWVVKQDGDDTRAKTDDVSWLNGECEGKTSVLSDDELAQVVKEEYPREVRTDQCPDCGRFACKTIEIRPNEYEYQCWFCGRSFD